MKEISSRDNPLFKRLRALATAPQRQRRDGVALLDGAHLAQAWLAVRGQPDLCLVSPQALLRPEIAAIAARVEDSRCLLMPESMLAQIATVEQSAGLLFFVTVVPTAEAGQAGGTGQTAGTAETAGSIGAGDPAGAARTTSALTGFDPLRATASCVILDGIQDAGNAGTILRSAAAAGIGQVFSTVGTAYLWAPKVLRAGMGAHFVLTLVEQVDPATLRERLGIPLVVTELEGATDLYDCNLARPLAWVFGNEGAGVAEIWRRYAGLRVRIPQAGGVESLNVAAAAAVCLFEQRRQYRLA